MKRIGNRTYPELRDLYPDKDDAWFARAEENLRQYILFCVRQYERIRADPKEYARFKELTRSLKNPRLKETGTQPDHE